MTDLWLEAALDNTDEDDHRRYVAARAATAPIFQFLAIAKTENDYENRKALQADRITAECARIVDGADCAVLVNQVMSAMDNDYLIMQAKQEIGMHECEQVTNGKNTQTGKPWTHQDRVKKHGDCGICSDECNQCMSKSSAKFAAALYSRQHYNHIANTVHNYQQAYGAAPGLADHFTTAMSGTNSNFQPERFRAACNEGTPQGKPASMTKMHFKHLADTVASAPDPHGALASHFADSLGDTNSRFDRDKFLSAATPHTASKTANKYIKKQGDEWVIIQKGTGKVLSHHDSKEKANASFRAMMESKHGAKETKTCPNCKGEGYFSNKSTGYDMMVGPQKVPCKTCKGKGTVTKSAGYDRAIDPQNEPDWGSCHCGSEMKGGKCRECGPDCQECRENRRESSKTAATAWSPASGFGNRDHANRPYKPTHEYHPNGWDKFDARPHPGSNPIAAGSWVMSHGKMDPSGHLLHVSDEEGNHQTVDKRSLQRMGYAQRQNQQTQLDAIPKYDANKENARGKYLSSLHTSSLDVEVGLDEGEYVIDKFGAIHLAETVNSSPVVDEDNERSAQGQDTADENNNGKMASTQGSFLGDEVPWGREPDQVDNTYHCAHAEHVPESHKPFVHEARFNAPEGKTCKYCNKEMSGEPAVMVHGLAFAQPQLQMGAKRSLTGAHAPKQSAYEYDDPYDDPRACTHCNGNGKHRSGNTCTMCGGTGEAPDYSKKTSLWKRIKNKVAGGNSDNFLETCPICGKEIPKSQMEHHMEKDHPHEVRRHTSTRKTANPFDSDSNPFSPGTDTGAAAAPDITTPMTSPPRTKPATNPMAPDMPQAPAVMPVMPQVPGQTMPEMPGGNAGNDTKQGFASKRASKIADIAVGIMDSNPGINEDRAIYLATKTVNEYPNMIHESRGGADWISTDGMSQCPQCGKEALDEEEGRCHFCGYQQAHKNVEGFDPLAGPTTMTPAKAPITGNPGLR